MRELIATAAACAVALDLLAMIILHLPLTARRAKPSYDFYLIMILNIWRVAGCAKMSVGYSQGCYLTET